MPELPEVEVVRAGLSATSWLPPSAPRRGSASPPGPPRPARSKGLRRRADPVVAWTPSRRGELLWFALDNGDALLGHLGVSGQMHLVRSGADDRHLRCSSAWAARGTPAPTAVRRTDVGGLLVSEGGADLRFEIAHVARDPLDPEFDVGGVRRRTAAHLGRQAPGSTRPWSTASATSTPTRRCRGRWSTAATGDELRRGQGPRSCSTTPTRCRSWPSGGRHLLRRASTSTSTAGPATSTSRCRVRPEGEPCDRCVHARPETRVALVNRSSYFCPVYQTATSGAARPDGSAIGGLLQVTWRPGSVTP